MKRRAVVAICLGTALLASLATYALVVYRPGESQETLCRRLARETMDPAAIETLDASPWTQADVDKILKEQEAVHAAWQLAHAEWVRTHKAFVPAVPDSDSRRDRLRAEYINTAFGPPLEPRKPTTETVEEKNSWLFRQQERVARQLADLVFHCVSGGGAKR